MKIELSKIIKNEQFVQQYRHCIIYAVTIMLCYIIFYKDNKIVCTPTSMYLFVFEKILIISSLLAILTILFYKKRFQISILDYLIGISLFTLILKNNSFENPDISQLILLGITYFILRFIFHDQNSLIKICSIIFLIVGIIECWIGYLQLYGFVESSNTSHTLTGSFFNPGPYSGLLATISPIALYWVLKIYPQASKLTYQAIKEIIRIPKIRTECFIFGLSAICFSGILMLLPAGRSRSAWIAGLIGCSIIIIKHCHLVSKIKKYYREKKRQTIAFGFIFLLLVTGCGTGVYFMKKDSADGRMLIWQITFQIIKKNPWGVGEGYFPGAYGEAQADYFQLGKASSQEELVAGSPEHAFNEYLQIGAEHGIAGLLLFGAIIFFAIWQITHTKTTEVTAISGAFIAFLIFALFSYPLRIFTLRLIFIILLSIIGSYPISYDLRSNSRISGLTFKIPYALSLVFVLIITGLTYRYIHKGPSRDSYLKWVIEKSYLNSNIYKITVDNYKKLYSQLKHEKNYLYEYGLCLAETAQYKESNKILYEGTKRSSDPMFYNIIGENYQAMKQYDLAEQAFYHASLMIPHRIYPLYLTTKMYFESGQIEKGIKMSKIVLNKKPKKISQTIEKMRTEIETLLNKYQNR